MPTSRLPSDTCRTRHAVDPGAVAQAEVDVPTGGSAQPRHRCQEGRQRNPRMLLQVPAHARVVGDHGNAQRPATTEPGRCPDRSRMAGLWMAPAQTASPYRASMRSGPPRLGVRCREPCCRRRAQRRTWRSAMMSRFGRARTAAAEIRHRGRDAVLVPSFESVCGKISVLEAPVLVVDVGEAGSLQRAARRRARSPANARAGCDGSGSARPCRAADPSRSRSCLEPDEIWQHVSPTPAGRARLLPLVVVVGRAAVGDLAVDAGAAAHEPRLLVAPGARARGVVVADRLEIGLAARASDWPGRKRRGRDTCPGWRTLPHRASRRARPRSAARAGRGPPTAGRPARSPALPPPTMTTSQLIPSRLRRSARR